MEMAGLECQKIALVISSLMFTWTPKLRCSVNGRNHWYPDLYTQSNQTFKVVVVPLSQPVYKELVL